MVRRYRSSTEPQRQCLFVSFSLAAIKRLIRELQSLIGVTILQTMSDSTPISSLWTRGVRAATPTWPSSNLSWSTRWWPRATWARRPAKASTITPRSETLRLILPSILRIFYLHLYYFIFVAFLAIDSLRRNLFSTEFNYLLIDS